MHTLIQPSMAAHQTAPQGPGMCQGASVCPPAHQGCLCKICCRWPVLCTRASRFRKNQSTETPKGTPHSRRQPQHTKQHSRHVPTSGCVSPPTHPGCLCSHTPGLPMQDMLQQALAAVCVLTYHCMCWNAAGNVWVLNAGAAVSPPAYQGCLCKICCNRPWQLSVC
jgi:hypothetical protein